MEMYRCSCFFYDRIATRRVYKTGLIGPTPLRLSTNFQPTSGNSSFVVSFSLSFPISKRNAHFPLGQAYWTIKA